MNYLSELLYRVLLGSGYLNCYFVTKNNILLSLYFIHKSLLLIVVFIVETSSVVNTFIYLLLLQVLFNFSSCLCATLYTLLKTVTINYHMLFIFVISCLKDWSLYISTLQYSRYVHGGIVMVSTFSIYC